MNMSHQPSYSKRPQSITLYSVTPWAAAALVVVFVFSFLRGDPLIDASGRPSRGPMGVGGRAPAIAVWNTQASSLYNLPLEEYVRGVVAAEVPAGFHAEALKAQAVAARTYALRRIERDERLPAHGHAHVTSDFRLHQAWTDEQQFLAARPPELGAQQWDAIVEAVDATRGIVLTYQGELIEALYHSTSGGHTEDASRYFQSTVPYLKAVPDPYGDHSPLHTSRTIVPLDTAFARLGVASARAASAGFGRGAAVYVRSRTPSGRAEEVIVGGQTFTGRQVREALGLRSNWFDVRVDGNRVIFDVRGSGHGVGMPQYGADGMGRAGHSYKSILAHYYQGTTLQQRY